MGLLLIHKSEVHGNRRHPDTVYKRKSVCDHFVFNGVKIGRSKEIQCSSVKRRHKGFFV